MTRAAGVLPRSERVLTIGPLVAVAVLCWAVVWRWMGGMSAVPGADPGPIGFFIGAWVVMMAAMMLPSAWPTVLVFRRLQAARRERGHEPVRLGPALFLLGYLAAWCTAGLVGFVVVRTGRALDLDALNWERAGRLLAAGVVIAAAAYQLTPLKDRCLRHCRGPFSFLLEHWRPGGAGAVRMGVRHGMWCIGCCWGLMAALFALGLMSIPWMALITLFIAAEKLLPWRRGAMAVVTISLVALGVAIAVVPDRVPWLMTPGPAVHGMNMSINWSPGQPPPGSWS